MSMSANEIENMIKEAIPGSIVVIEDLRGDGDHYSAHVKSELFNGKSKIQQHQMVYKALKGKMGQQLHALALKTSADL
jgi:stress-induced morphogen